MIVNWDYLRFMMRRSVLNQDGIARLFRNVLVKSNRNGTTYLLKSPKGRLLYFGIRNDGSREDRVLGTMKYSELSSDTFDGWKFLPDEKGSVWIWMPEVSF